MFAAYTSQLELSNRKATSARAVLRPRRSPLLRCRHPKRVGNESSQRASGRVRIFRKRGGQLGLHLETLHSSLHYLTTVLLPLLVGWRRAADPRLAEEN